MKQHFQWIDNVKAICMIGVFLLHSEVYYGFGSVQYGVFFTPFYVNAFFFVSGYLMFRKYLNCDNFTRSMYLNALQNAVFRLMIPSIIFSAVIFLPKMLFHGAEVSINAFLVNVFGGVSFWFTSALFVAQVALLTLIALLRRKDIWSYLLCSVLLFIPGWYLNYVRTDMGAESFFPWFWETGIEYTLLMSLGGVYFQCESRINALSRYFLPVAAVIYVAAMAMSLNGAVYPVMGLSGRCSVEGGLLILAGVSLIVAICHAIKENNIMSFIGRNSIVFYFLSGVFPAFVGMVARRFVPDCNYAVTIAVATLSLIFAWFAAMIIERYLPFIIDIRKLKR